MIWVKYWKCILCCVCMCFVMFVCNSPLGWQRYWLLGVIRWSLLETNLKKRKCYSLTHLTQLTTISIIEIFANHNDYLWENWFRKIMGNIAGVFISCLLLVLIKQSTYMTLSTSTCHDAWSFTSVTIHVFSDTAMLEIDVVIVQPLNTREINGCSGA